VSIYGQEANHTTWQLAAMNMVIRGIDFNFGKEPASSYTNDQHPDLRADYIMANPPFNMKEWDTGVDDNDPRWVYGKPPTNNANFAWLQHMLYHLAPSGSMGLLLANGSMSSNDDWKISEDHPWELIAFYRAMLLVQNGREADARDLIKLSLEICDDHPDGTITWIGAVIGRCAEHFGILPTDLLIKPGKRLDIVRKVLPNAPIDRFDNAFSKSVNLSNFDAALRQLLPFNFR